MTSPRISISDSSDEEAETINKRLTIEIAKSRARRRETEANQMPLSASSCSPVPGPSGLNSTSHRNNNSRPPSTLMKIIQPHQFIYKRNVPMKWTDKYKASSPNQTLLKLLREANCTLTQLQERREDLEEIRQLGSHWLLSASQSTHSCSTNSSSRDGPTPSKVRKISTNCSSRDNTVNKCNRDRGTPTEKVAAITSKGENIRPTSSSHVTIVSTSDQDHNSPAEEDNSSRDINHYEGLEERSENDLMQGFAISNNSVADLTNTSPAKIDNDARNETDDNEEVPLNQALLLLLECPVCLDCMEPPMAQCRRGHLTCQACRDKMLRCPVCRASFTAVRNRAMEQVAEKLRYPCRHGCGAATALRLRGAHEASCASRRHACPLPGCHADAMPHETLINHFLDQHPDVIAFGTKGTFRYCRPANHHDWIMSSHNNIFHVQFHTSNRNHGIHGSVTYIGPKKNASRYQYDIILVGAECSRKLVYSRDTHSDLDCRLQVYAQGDAFFISFDNAICFTRPNNILDFKVEVHMKQSFDNAEGGL